MNDTVRTFLSICAVIALAVFVWASLYVAALDALAERAGHGWGGDGEYSRRYDLRTVCGISGEVVRVERFAPRHGVCRGVYLVLREGGEDLLVALGPTWFVDAGKQTFAAGDRIEAVGSRIDYHGEAVLVAAEVTKDGQSLTLREPNGKPVWAGEAAVSDRDGRDAANRERPVAAPPLYQTDLERHLWSWEDHEVRA